MSGSRLVIHVPQTINVKRAPNKLLDTACYSPIEPYGFQAMKCKKIDSNYSRKYDKIRTFWIFIIASKSYGTVGLWQAVSKSLFGALFTFIVWGTWITNLEPLKWDGSLMTQRMRQGKKQSFFHAFFQRFLFFQQLFCKNNASNQWFFLKNKPVNNNKTTLI